MSAPFGLDRASVDALGWTLVHFIWQGAFIAFVFAVLNRMFARVGANVRYLLGCGTLLLMLLAPISTFVVLRDAASTPSPRFTAQQAPRTARAPIARKSPSAVLVATESSQARIVPMILSGMRSARLAALLPWFVTAWGIGVLLLSIRLLGGWWMVHRLRRSMTNTVIPEWQPRLQTLARRIGVSRPVRLFRSALVQVPTAIGWLHPMILLPASTLTGLTPQQIESILAHELAHIRRHDYLVNLLQSLVETLLFYHPAVWWVSRRIREERELCCDDLAVRVAGDPLVYADALYRLEQMRGQAAPLALAANGGSLLARIKRLIATPHGDDQSSRGLAAVLGTAIVFVLMTTPGVQSTGGGVRVATAAARVMTQTSQVTQQKTTLKTKITTKKVDFSSIRGLLNEPLIAEINEAAKAIPALVSIATEPVAPVDLVGPVAPVVGSAPVVWVDDSEAAAKAMSEEDAEDAKTLTVTVSKGSRSQYTVDEWIELSRHGVDPDKVSEYEAAGLKGIPAKEMIALADNGVSPDFVSEIRSGKRSDIGTRDLIRLAQNGVSADYVNGLSDLGAGDLSADELIRLAQNGATPEWYAALRWMGYPGLTVDRAIRLLQQGVSAEYVNQLKIVGRKRFTLDELVAMRQQGVEPEYVGGMVASLNNLGARELIALRQQGVDPDYVAKMLVAGKFGIAELIALRQQGVDPEYVFEMSAAGYPGLTTEDLIRLRQSGVDGDFVVEAREAGYPKASVSEIIRLRQQGIPCNKKKKD